MSARIRMTMRATIQRNMAGLNPYGDKAKADWQYYGEVPCHIWEKSGSTILENGKVVTVNMPIGIMSNIIDIDEDDRILGVADRRGRQLFGTMYIDTILKHKDHISLRLKKYD